MILATPLSKWALLLPPSAAHSPRLHNTINTHITHTKYQTHLRSARCISCGQASLHVACICLVVSHRVALDNDEPATPVITHRWAHEFIST